MKTSKLILLLGAVILGSAFTTGCSKGGKNSRSDNSGYYGNGGYNGNGANGTVGAIGRETQGRFTLGLRLGTNGNPQAGGQVSASGTIRVTQPLGCYAPNGQPIGVPAGANINLAPKFAGQISPIGQISNLGVGANIQNNVAIEVIVLNGGIEAIAGNINTCMGTTSTELYGMVLIRFVDTQSGSPICNVPTSYVDLITPQQGAGC